jgi:hypothetical protein
MYSFNWIVPLFMRGYDNEFLMLRPVHWLKWVLWGLTLFFLTVTILQSKYGGRLCYPKRWLPGYHDYRVRISDLKRRDPEFEGYECPICFGNIEEGDEEETGQGERLVQKRQFCVGTKCRHYFHRECLAIWME